MKSRRRGLTKQAASPKPAAASNKRTSPINWLESLDARAATLPPAQSWLQPYDYFLLTRYPHLQPCDPVLPDLPDGYVRRGKPTYERRLDKQEMVLAEKVDPRAIEGLSPQQLREVAALTLDITVDLEESAKFKDALADLEETARQAARLERGFASDEGKIEEIIANRCDAVARSKPMIAKRKIHDLYNQILQTLASVELELGPVYFSQQVEYLRESGYFQKAEDETSDNAMVPLYWLFQSGCRLSKGESELRVALIRNQLWGSFLKHVEHSLNKNEESPGCDAVRRAVQRFHI